MLDPDWRNTGEIHDNSMLVMRVSYGSVSFLLAGEMAGDFEARIPASPRPTTVLEVGHHGSRTSTSPSCPNTIRPEVAIHTVGACTSFGRPTTTQALGRLKAPPSDTFDGLQRDEDADGRAGMRLSRRANAT